MKLIYTPVVYGMKYNWWDEAYGQPLMYGMVSAGDSAYGLHANRSFQKPEGMELYADSGGFQCATQGLYMAPEAVAEWQEQINADVKIILDVPPRLTGVDGAETGRVRKGERFQRCLNETVDNTKTMLNTYKADSMIYGVLQGVDRQQVEEWIDKMNKLYDYDGWAVSVGKKGREPLQLKLKLLGDIGVKRIHLLGNSNLMVLTKAVQYMRDYKIDFCTYDSTRYIATKFSNVFCPVIENFTTWFSRSENKKDLRLICDCPVCKKLNPNAALERGDEVEFGYIVSIHNIYHTQRVSNVLVEASKYKDCIKEMEKVYSNICLPTLIEMAPQLSDFAGD